MHRLSSVAPSGGYLSLQREGFSLWWLLWLLGTGSRHTGFSRWWLPIGLSCPGGRWNLTGPGVQPKPPALAGKFSSTVPPGKSLYCCFLKFISLTSLGLSGGMRDPVPWPGTEPGPSALEVQSLSHWITSKSLCCYFKADECSGMLKISPWIKTDLGVASLQSALHLQQRWGQEVTQRKPLLYLSWGRCSLHTAFKKRWSSRGETCQV